jgi:hypothetical protein
VGIRVRETGGPIPGNVEHDLQTPQVVVHRRQRLGSLANPQDPRRGHRRLNRRWLAAEHETR